MPIPLPKQKGEWPRPVYTPPFAVYNGVYLKQKRAYAGGTFEGIVPLEPSISKGVLSYFRHPKPRG